MPRRAVHSGFRDITLRSGTMPRKLIGERPMTDAERQARHRAARAAGAPVVRMRRPADHRGRARVGMTCRAIDRITGAVCRLAGSVAGQPARRRHRRCSAGNLRARPGRASSRRTAARIWQGLTNPAPGLTPRTGRANQYTCAIRPNRQKVSRELPGVRHRCIFAPAR